MTDTLIAEAPAAADAPADYIARLAQAGDGPHDIATAALMFAALDHPDRKLEPYRRHISEIAEAARAELSFCRDAEDAAQALSHLLAVRYGFDGERGEYDEPANADLLSVIDRRRGLPVTLGILYMHAARAAGFEACGLYAPGHFLLKLTVRGTEAVVDAFNGGAIVDRERATSPHPRAGALFADAAAPDEPNPFEPVSDVEVLLRLQNNLKNRALKARDSARACEILRRMSVIAPKRAIVWMELARLEEGVGSLSAARKAYERCLDATRPGDLFQNEASLALRALKRKLN
jgi:regulator of sirC expression with transglutaminase-like and TPR domain